MQQYPLDKQYWEQSDSERALTTFTKEVERLKLELSDKGNEISVADKTRITANLNSQLIKMQKIGNLEACLARFQHPTPEKTERQRRWESHSSSRLGRNMRLAGKPQPDPCCQAHAIIAGTDPAAASMRGMLAVVGIRVDDPVNGAWLPGYEDNLTLWAMPNAVAHAWLNHDGYHNWLFQDILTESLVFGATENDGLKVAAKLKFTARRLQHQRDKVPDKAIQTKQDTARRKSTA